MKKIGVLGAGSWGTALTWLLTNNGHEVTLWYWPYRHRLPEAPHRRWHRI